MTDPLEATASTWSPPARGRPRSSSTPVITERRAPGGSTTCTPAATTVDRRPHRGADRPRPPRRSRGRPPNSVPSMSRATSFGVPASADVSGHRAGTGSRTSRPCRWAAAPGTRTEPSACWWFSRIATMVRGIAQSVPLSVATGAVPSREAAADVEPAGLELGAVRRRGQLAVVALGGDPRLAVELPLGRETEVTGGDVDDAVRQLELVEELLLPPQQPLVLGVGLLDAS